MSEARILISVDLLKAILDKVPVDQRESHAYKLAAKMWEKSK